MLDDLKLQCCVMSSVVSLLAIVHLARLWREGQFVSAIGGLHSNVLIFFGIGPFLYGLQDNVPERIGFEGVLLGLSKTGWYFVIGYAVLTLWRLPRPKLLFQSAIRPVYLGTMALAGVLGYLGAQTDFASSGVGTVFPVLKYFLYPTLFLAVVNMDRRDSFTVILAGTLLATTLFFAYVSPWRSEFISLAVCLTMGRFFRRSRISVPVMVGVAFLIWLFIPFLQVKKMEYDFAVRHPLSAIGESFSVSFAERSAIVSGLLAIRINAFREMGFVQNALDSNIIDRRFGSSYVEALQQLVPRILWPGKPSFNQTTNYLLARQIGLLGFEDPSTSWGVHTFAEFVWNFDAINLLWFVPLLFWCVAALERVVRDRLRSDAARTMVCSVYFFQFMVFVGLVGTVTYVVWLLVAAVGIVWMTGAVGRQAGMAAVRS